jgi:Rieske Fe-S protein
MPTTSKLQVDFKNSNYDIVNAKDQNGATTRQVVGDLAVTGGSVRLPIQEIGANGNTGTYNMQVFVEPAKGKTVATVKTEVKDSKVVVTQLEGNGRVYDSMNIKVDSTKVDIAEAEGVKTGTTKVQTAETTAADGGTKMDVRVKNVDVSIVDNKILLDKGSTGVDLATGKEVTVKDAVTVAELNRNGEWTTDPSRGIAQGQDATGVSQKLLDAKNFAEITERARGFREQVEKGRSR